MTHPGELTLRRYLAEEQLDAPIVAHLRECAECGAGLERLKREHEAFAAEIPFERFAAGVEKAARAHRKPVGHVRVNVRFALAIAASLVALVGAQLALQQQPGTRIKGGEVVDFVVAGANGQRKAAAIEQLAAGERVRIGVSGHHRFVIALSIDEHAVVSSLYAQEFKGQTWLPDALEFTGSGREHVVVVLSDEPVAEALVAAQLKAKFMGPIEALDVPGVQVHRTFIKP